jgi:hypothetical protein
MNSKTKIASVIVIALVAMLLIANTVTSVSASSKGHRAGVRDGLDHPFSQGKLDKYGDSYYQGFKSGCMSVAGNTKAACEDATDSG